MNESYAVAIRILSYREHSIFQLEQKLKKRDYTDDEILETVNALKQENYLDNNRFSHELARQQFNKRYGQNKILSLLSNHHIDGKITHRVMSKYSDNDFIKQAKQQLSKKNYSKNMPQKQKNKLIRHLQNRGFNLATILKAI